MNGTKTLWLLAALTPLFLCSGHAFAGQGGLLVALGLAAILNLGFYVPTEVGSPATSHMFIVIPFAGGGLIQFFSTHPSTEARVAGLMEMHRNGCRLAA